MRAVILTASTMKKTFGDRYYSGKCVTAMDLSSGRVIRLVSNRLGAPIENPYCDYFQPLDVIELSIIAPCPLLCQTENVLSDYQNARFLGKYPGDFRELYERFQRINYGDHSFMLDGSYKLTSISPFKHSLEIIKVSNLQITVEEKDAKKKAKCSFFYRSKSFKFVSVTDPEYKQVDGNELTIGDAYIIVSIPTDNRDGLGYFKFVAAVIPIISGR